MISKTVELIGGQSLNLGCPEISNSKSGSESTARLAEGRINEHRLPCGLIIESTLVKSGLGVPELDLKFPSRGFECCFAGSSGASIRSFRRSFTMRRSADKPMNPPTIRG